MLQIVDFERREKMKEIYELKDLKTRIVDKEYARRFISRYHYSKKCSGIVIAIGQWLGQELKNCIVFNACCGREMANQVYDGGDNNSVLELARMVSIEPKPKNLESYAISKALDWLKQNMPNIKVVISYADNTMGHHGYCYQASGFTYYGQSRPTIEYYLDGKRMHERNICRIYGCNLANMKKQLGDRLVLKFNEKQSREKKYNEEN